MENSDSVLEHSCRHITSTISTILFTFNMDQEARIRAALQGLDNGKYKSVCEAAIDQKVL